jgi:hypothetical protein
MGWIISEYGDGAGSVAKVSGSDAARAHGGLTLSLSMVFH